MSDSSKRTEAAIVAFMDALSDLVRCPMDVTETDGVYHNAHSLAMGKVEKSLRYLVDCVMSEIGWTLVEVIDNRIAIDERDEWRDL